MRKNSFLLLIGGARRLVPRFIRDRYLAKFVVMILLVVVVVGAIGAVGYVQATDSVEGNAESQLESTATAQANSIGDWVGEREDQATFISEDSALVANEDVDDYLQTRWSPADRTGIRAVHHVDRDEGVVLDSNAAGMEGQQLEDIDAPWTEAEFYDQARDDDVAHTDRAHRDATLDENVIAFASPIIGTDRYVVVMAEADSQVDRLVQPLDGQTTTIVNQDGESVLLPEEGEDAEVVFDPSDAEGGDGEATFVQDGGTVYAYAAVGNGWFAVTEVPTSSAFAVSETVAQSVLTIVAVTLISLLLAAVVLGRQTVTPLTRLKGKVAQMEEGDLEVDLETVRTDEIGQLYDGFATMRDSLRERIQEAQDAREDAEAARQEAEEMNRHLETKADEYNRIIGEWSEGDLTRRLDPDSRNQAMTNIARDLNDMVADLEVAIDHVKDFATQTAAASEQATASTEEVRAASQQVTESIQEISAGSERQNDKLLKVAEEMNNLSATTEEIASLSNQVAGIAGQTAETGQEGRASARAAIDAMEDIEDASNYAVNEIRQLEEEEVGQIDELIERIQEIAEQTNMLALNANIEASRSSAGEDEGGFGVVAQEVKELSQDAKEAADEIEQRLEAIREQTARSADEVEQTSELIGEASARVEETVEGLEEIAEFAAETNQGVQEINDVTEAQAQSTEEVVTQVEEVTTISEETTAEAETVASAAEEQTASLVETSKSVEDLSQRASRLSEALDRFDTKVSDERRQESELEVP